MLSWTVRGLGKPEKKKVSQKSDKGKNDGYGFDSRNEEVKF